jgi:4-methyl-5(b-hydroxyethyl)-thiazole monophosphate biosynthesis
MTKKAIVLLAEGFEEIEAITCIDILRRAGLTTIVAGITGLTVKGAQGLEIKANQKLNQSSFDYDACILPGGMPGADNLAASEKATGLIKKMENEKKIIAAICASPAIVLAPLGILNNKTATCYPGLESNFSNSTIYKNQEVVSHENIITGQGPASALKFALKITEHLAGKKISGKIAKATLFR